MIDYLYYKLYRATLRSSVRDIAEYVAPVYLGGAISTNLLVLNGFLARLNIIPFFLKSGMQGGIFVLILIAVTFFYYRAKYKKIVAKYWNETKSERIKGNIVVSVYIGVSFLLIFAVAFFRR